MGANSFCAAQSQLENHEPSFELATSQPILYQRTIRL